MWQWIFQFISIVLLAGALFYAAKQMTLIKTQLELVREATNRDHDWRRRKAAQDATLTHYERRQLDRRLVEIFDYMNRKEPIPAEDVRQKCDDVKNLKLDIHKLLNFYESLARGVNESIYDEEVVRVAVASVMSKAFQMFQQYIIGRRQNGNPELWRQLEILVARWNNEAVSRPRRSSTNVS